MILIVDFKNGLMIEVDNVIWCIVEFQYVKFGKGGVFVCLKFKNLWIGVV